MDLYSTLLLLNVSNSRSTKNNFNQELRRDTEPVVLHAERNLFNPLSNSILTPIPQELFNPPLSYPLSKIVDKELKKVKSWLDCNKRGINIDKISFVLFHSPRKKHPNLINLKSGKSSSKKIEYGKFLSALIDEYLPENTISMNFIRNYLEEQGSSIKLDTTFPVKLPFVSTIHSSLPCSAVILLSGSYLYLLYKPIIPATKSGILFQSIFVLVSIAVFRSKLKVYLIDSQSFQKYLKQVADNKEQAAESHGGPQGPHFLTFRSSEMFWEFRQKCFEGSPLCYL